MTTHLLPRTHLTRAALRFPSIRTEGVLLMACAAGSLVLLMNHPNPSPPHTFAEMLRSEAAMSGPDAVVHGGYIALLSVQFVCLCALAVGLGVGRTVVLAALVFTAIGSAALGASMFIDGLIIPAVAARYAAVPAQQLDAARGLFAVLATFIRFLMPVGLLFVAFGTFCWSAALLGGGAFSKCLAIFGIVVGVVIASALAITYSSLNVAVLAGGLAAQAIWTIGLGALFARASSPSNAKGALQGPAPG